MSDIFESCTIGIEFGTTRVKAVLVDENAEVKASGTASWENHLIGGIWTYSMGEVKETLQSCYLDLKKSCVRQYGEVPKKVASIGVSALMHGFLPLGEDREPLVPFRTWRNTMTAEAAAVLSEAFGYNIPQRWGIAHLYQAILNDEPEVKDLKTLSCLSVYVTEKLTGQVSVGLGEASGLFPISYETLDYDERMIGIFEDLIRDRAYPWNIRDVLPKAKKAGETAGHLTAQGALYIDPEGDLEPGIAVAAPEGDAETGMVATNTIRPGTASVSAGTSAFTLMVMDHLPNPHPEIAVLSTPDGFPAANVHGSNCTSDLNAWVSLFSEVVNLTGHPADREELFTKLFEHSKEADPDAGGLLSYNYYAGEAVTHINEGRPVFARMENAEFSLANFMRLQVFSAFATMTLGLDILEKEENVRASAVTAHGGLFKTPGVADRILSAALRAPVKTMKTASEGGPFGMALLAAYSVRKKEGETLPDFLGRFAFRNTDYTEVMATEEEIEGYRVFLERYRKAFPLEIDATRFL
ncbi:MAG: ATPase [Lachnospiraceae bacterium]|nr:ATPase [Lachnospiraceae bacterium]